MKKSRKTDAANRTSDIAAGSLFRKSVLFMLISFGKFVLFSLVLKPDMTRNSFRSVFLNTLVEEALRKLSSCKRLTAQYVSSRRVFFR